MPLGTELVSGSRKALATPYLLKTKRWRELVQDKNFGAIRTEVITEATGIKSLSRGETLERNNELRNVFKSGLEVRKRKRSNKEQQEQ